ncbi:hypothetical protein L1987_43289 [Smallanthus sonchifolius]|uniref:Uncharacterized protein n=1 Tax=Smallanthus sonchifolius TaxID=185202 RepID=A0ACB9GM78_9ASTR|nr:hypothetical protein L1987_43289 [Smallanthus sonchifolius]
MNEPVQEEAVQENEQDLGMNMEDFNDEAVNSPIHECEGNVVEEQDSSSSSSETILPVSEETDSDESRYFCSDHYERLANVPLANAGKCIKSTARRPRRKSIRDPPSGTVLGKRTLIDESSDSDSDFNLDPKAQKLMSASIAAAHSSQGVEDATFVASLLVTPPRSTHVSPVITPVPPVDTLVSTDAQRQLGELRIHDTCHTESIQQKDVEDNDPTGNVEGDLQYAADVNPISRVQGESTSQTIEGNKDDSGVNEEILLLKFFEDSEEEEAEKIECLDDIDELFNDIDDEVSDNEVEEGEIVEIEIEKNKDKVTYEGSDGLKVPYNFIQDDVIPELSYEGVTDSMDSIEDITMPEDTDDENVQPI